MYETKTIDRSNLIGFEEAFVKGETTPLSTVTGMGVVVEANHLIIETTDKDVTFERLEEWHL